MSSIPADLRQYVDETGLLLEAGGLPRTAGQVLGWMLVCEPEHQSLSDLTTALSISKASASTVTRMLMQFGFLERTLGAGDRRDYYRISRNAWERFLRSRIDFMHKMRHNAERGLQILESSPPGRCDRLERMHRLYSFLEREISGLLDRFENEESERAAVATSGALS